MNWHQFLFSSESRVIGNMTRVATIQNRHLYLGECTRYCSVQNDNHELHLVGEMMSWQNPERDNVSLLADLSDSRDIHEVLQKSNAFCGQFILIVRFGDDVQIFNDASALREIYYTTDFQHLASQVKLLGNVAVLEKHDDQDAIEFFRSDVFEQQKIFVGDQTHCKNVLHLRPNHILRLKDQRSERFFPLLQRSPSPTKVVAPQCAKMMQGYTQAAAQRSAIEMGVTGGYDSRLLFLASLGLDCRYFIRKPSNMPDDHWEISIPKRLTEYYNQSFVIERAEEEDCAEADVLERYLHDLDFPRPLGTMRKGSDRSGIGGNVSEIARNYYEYHTNVTSKDLSHLLGLGSHRFSVQMCSKWIQELETTGACGYNLLDLFYWEERMGNWCAKKSSESLALNERGTIPFNSRDLLQLMLSTPRNDRDQHSSPLYDAIIKNLSNGDKWLASLPINPSFKIRLIRLLKKIHLFQLYRFIALKTRLI
jgi:hypothetical protein